MAVLALLSAILAITYHLVGIVAYPSSPQYARRDIDSNRYCVSATPAPEAVRELSFLLCLNTSYESSFLFMSAPFFSLKCAVYLVGFLVIAI